MFLTFLGRNIVLKTFYILVAFLFFTQGILASDSKQDIDLPKVETKDKIYKNTIWGLDNTKYWGSLIQFVLECVGCDPYVEKAETTTMITKCLSGCIKFVHGCYTCSNDVGDRENMQKGLKEVGEGALELFTVYLDNDAKAIKGSINNLKDNLKETTIKVKQQKEFNNLRISELKKNITDRHEKDLEQIKALIDKNKDSPETCESLKNWHDEVIRRKTEDEERIKYYERSSQEEDEKINEIIKDIKTEEHSYKKYDMGSYVLSLGNKICQDPLTIEYNKEFTLRCALILVKADPRKAVKYGIEIMTLVVAFYDKVKVLKDYWINKNQIELKENN